MDCFKVWKLIVDTYAMQGKQIIGNCIDGKIYLSGGASGKIATLQVINTGMFGKSKELVQGANIHEIKDLLKKNRIHGDIWYEGGYHLWVIKVWGKY